MSNAVDKKQLLEAAILVAGEPVTVDQLMQLFPEDDQVTVNELRQLLAQITESYADRGIELVQVASGYRFQAKVSLAPWLQRLSEGKVPRYSRTFLETLALIAYKQPITRGEIEEVRGVAVNSNVMKQLLDREWIKIVGYKEVPGKPALFGTTKQFLDYFSLKALSDLPALQDLADLEEAEAQLGQQLSLEITAEDESVPVIEEPPRDRKQALLDDELILEEIDRLIESVG